MKKLFYLLLALPLALVSCEKPVETPNGTNPDAVTLSVTSEKEIHFTAEGGEATIAYTLENAVEEALATASTEAEWITVGDVTASTIAYSVASNESEEERSAVITVSYNDLKQEVTIKQAGAEAPVAIQGWGIVGSMTNNWDLQSVITMPLEGGYYAVKGLALTTTDTFMFVKDGAYTESFGSAGTPCEANYSYDTVKAGSSIRVKEDGTYDIYLNESLTKYYVMSEGTDPSEATDALKPGEIAWYVAVGQTEVRMNTQNKFLVAKDIVLGAEGTFSLYNSNNNTYYAEGTFETNKAIKVVRGDKSITVNCDPEAKYDIYFRESDSLVWVVDAGTMPKDEVIWTKVEGVHFYDYDITNFGIFFISNNLIINVELYSGIEPKNSIIPEGIYYVGGDENDNGFIVDSSHSASNLEINGFESNLYSGTIEVKHISGGYDFIIKIVSTHQHNIDVRYTGPVASNPYMGRPISNPE
ncbi:MAG: BACON domain-containing protein [Alistipes sp.]|nr:BACON domain-containing protein [Alistipes sp.]